MPIGLSTSNNSLLEAALIEPLLTLHEHVYCRQYLATTKYVHVLTANWVARTWRKLTASATAMSFEERLMKEVHACSEPEETIGCDWLTCKRCAWCGNRLAHQSQLVPASVAHMVTNLLLQSLPASCSLKLLVSSCSRGRTSIDGISS